MTTETKPGRTRLPRLTPPQIELLTDIVTKPQMYLRHWSREEKSGGCLTALGLASMSSEGPGHSRIVATQAGRDEAVRRGLVPALEVVTLAHGTDRYASLLSGIWQNMRLISAMWADAESRPTELDEPGTSWNGRAGRRRAGRVVRRPGPRGRHPEVPQQLRGPRAPGPRPVRGRLPGPAHSRCRAVGPACGDVPVRAADRAP